MQRRLAAILVIDVVGYSGMMEQDEVGTLKRLRGFRSKVFDPAVAAGQGRVVKLTGDGALVEFVSVVKAVECGMKIQSAAAARNATLDAGERIEVRIGINLGDIVVEADDIYGDGVNVAARLEQLAPVGGLCISGSVYDHIQGKVNVSFKDLGALSVKNIQRPIQTWSWMPGAERLAEPTKPPNTVGQAAIAVLPFVNMSERRELEFLADGLTEDIITLLSRVPGFLVIARNSTFAYKGKSPDIRDVGRELDVGYVVEGSMRPVGDRIRVTTQLIETATGNHLWADRFDQSAERIDELLDEITQAIVAKLEPELARAEFARIRRRGSDNLDAWACYKQASGLLSLKGWHRETFAEATDLLQQAIALDPDFALAHAYLSLLLALGHIFGLGAEGEDSEAGAVAAAEQAMDIDSRDPSVLGFAGCALCDLGRLERGIGVLQRAIDADPSNAQAWVAMGTALLRRGKARPGVEMLRHGMRISPLDNRLAFWGTNLAFALFRLRNFDEAEDVARQACRRDDKNYMGQIVLAMILADRGRLREARRAAEEAHRLRPDLSAANVRTLIGRRGVQILAKADLLA